MLFDNNEFNYEKLLEEMRKVSNCILRYELEEAIVVRGEDGKLVHPTQEMLGIDPDIFIGLEDIL
jgi:aspartate carbamoyltransferase catalytic subunit